MIHCNLGPCRSILRQYPSTEKSIKKYQKHLAYLQDNDKTPLHPREWTIESFKEYKQILADFYSAEYQAMTIMMKATTEKQSAFSSFFDKFPDLQPVRRANATDA
jgi:hypothetical protein